MLAIAAFNVTACSMDAYWQTCLSTVLIILVHLIYTAQPSKEMYSGQVSVTLVSYTMAPPIILPLEPS